MPYLKHGDELLFGDANSFSITTIDHIDNCIGIGIVTSPVGPNRGLATEIPYLEF